MRDAVQGNDRRMTPPTRTGETPTAGSSLQTDTSRLGSMNVAVTQRWSAVRSSSHRRRMGLNGQHAVGLQQPAATSAYCSFLTKPFVLLTASIILLLFASEFWPLDSSTSRIRARASCWKSPRPLWVPHKAAYNSTWQQRARANLSTYQSDILALVQPYYSKRHWWDVFVPIITCPPDRPLTRYGGTGDGSKLLCKLGDRLKHNGCVIYSFGSKGHYGFEQSMLDETLCQVHTFDCTYNGTSHHSRHYYHKWCVGDAKGGHQYRSWRNVTASLGHTRVDRLKMDIEGHEHEVLPTWTSDGILPDEVAIEIHAGAQVSTEQHYPNTTVELALTFLHLANLGFAAYAQEVNARAPWCCSEFTFMRLHDYHQV